jgi:hypothetical protein
VITHASVARGSLGNERSSAGNATLTIDRSSDAMKAASAVTTKMTRRRLTGVAAGVLGAGALTSVMR